MGQQEMRQGQQLGHYLLGQRLGQGGFAEVYAGEHLHLHTHVAIKVLHTRLTHEDILAFQREAQTVARLIHPNIVRVLDFGVEDGLPYLVMDHAPNGTLRQAFAKGTPLPLHMVVSFTKQVASALQYAHGQKLIHRDVKPENMLLGKEREVLLSDFGIALALQSSHMQSTQNIAGTIAYMAPEQIQAHPRPASDQYALGIVVYEWLCGLRPFQGSYTEIAVKQSIVAPPPLASYNPAIPPVVEQVVLRALQKDPQHRFPDVQSFAVALEQAAWQASTQTATSTTFVRPQPAPEPTGPTFIPSTFISAPPQVAPNSSGQPLFTPSMHTSPSAYTPATNLLFTPPQPAPSATYTPMPQPLGSAGPLAVQPAGQRRGISRRALLVGGAIGLLTVGGTAATLAYQHGLGSNPLTQVLGNHPLLLGQQNVGQATLELSYKQHTAFVWVVRWSPDGSTIASGSDDGTMQVWTADTGVTRLSVRSTVQPARSDDFPWSIAWSPRKNGRVAVGFVDGTVQVLDAKSGQRLPSFLTSVGAQPLLAWSPHEDFLAIGGDNNIVQIYSYPARQIVTTYSEHTDTITALAWSPDGTLLASGSGDTTTRLWEPHGGQTKLVYQGQSGRIASLDWSADSTRLVSTADDQTAKIWRVNAGTTLATYHGPGGGPIGQASWSHDAQTIAVYGGNASIYLLDPQTGQVRTSFASGVAYSLSWSPDDTRIVTGNYFNVAQVWRIG